MKLANAKIKFCDTISEIEYETIYSKYLDPVIFEIT